MFYPRGGGQPGDRGTLVTDGAEIAIVDTVKGGGGDDILHVPAEGSPSPAPGTEAIVEIDCRAATR